MAGVVLHLRQDDLWFYAEAGRNGFPEIVIDSDGDHLWDNRFVVSVAGSDGRRLVIGPRGPGERSGTMPAAAVAGLPTVRSADGADLPTTLKTIIRPIRTQLPLEGEDCRPVAWQGNTDNLS
jgi:tRNA(Ile)-lysidine synthase